MQPQAVVPQEPITVADAASAWDHKWAAPPPDLAVEIEPPGSRDRAAEEIAEHVRRQLEHGRSLYRIVRDEQVRARIGGCDGRALPPHCLADLPSVEGAR